MEIYRLRQTGCAIIGGYQAVRNRLTVGCAIWCFWLKCAGVAEVGFDPVCVEVWGEDETVSVEEIEEVFFDSIGFAV